MTAMTKQVIVMQAPTEVFNFEYLAVLVEVCVEVEVHFRDIREKGAKALVIR